LIVLFRSCETNLSPGSLGDGTENIPRWNGRYKLEIIRKCYKSLQSGLDETDQIVIINDNTSQETLEWMRSNTKAQFSVINITPLAILRAEHPFPQYNSVLPASCMELMEYIVETAENNPEEIIYVCEDDYLHIPNAISVLKSIFDAKFTGFFVPYDYPDRYTTDKNKYCELHNTPVGHVRTVPSGTLTMAARGKTCATFKYDLLRAGVFADDSWTWKAFAQATAISPIPGVATHLQEYCITPRVDWETVYNKVIV
jgi:glycosyltransferase involved in cell wall biosynthesis